VHRSRYELRHQAHWPRSDVEGASKENPFGGPVAHGCLTPALLAELSMDIGFVPKDAKAAFNYGLDKVGFLRG
jgi:acyl dehydratase